MAVMQSRDNRTFIAGEDLSAAQFKFVTLEAMVKLIWLTLLVRTLLVYVLLVLPLVLL